MHWKKKNWFQTNPVKKLLNGKKGYFLRSLSKNSHCLEDTMGNPDLRYVIGIYQDYAIVDIFFFHCSLYHTYKRYNYWDIVATLYYSVMWTVTLTLTTSMQDSFWHGFADNAIWNPCRKYLSELRNYEL